MRYKEENLHAWTYEPDQAIHIQEQLRDRLVLSWDDRLVNSIGGVAFIQEGERIHAVITVFSYPELALLMTASGEAPVVFPYLSGLLAFYAGPAILAAWERLKLKPDVLMLPGHGIAHPRHMGLASHIGVWLDLPTIGVAKSQLYGFQASVEPPTGEWVELIDEHNKKEVIGAVLRTQANAKPIFVSAGNRIDLSHAIEFVLRSVHGFRMPEPLRLAHQILEHQLTTAKN